MKNTYYLLKLQEVIGGKVTNAVMTQPTKDGTCSIGLRVELPDGTLKDVLFITGNDSIEYGFYDILTIPAENLTEN